MTKRLPFVLLVLFTLTAIVLISAQEKLTVPDIHIKSIKLMPGRPIVVAGCKEETSGGYLRMPDISGALMDSISPSYSPAGTHVSDPTNEQIGAFVRSELKKGIISTFYPDEGGIFVTSECQK